VDRLLEEVMGIMRGCPPELRLRGGMDSRVQRWVRLGYIHVYSLGYLQADDLAVGVIVQVESSPKTQNRSCKNYSSIRKPAGNTLGMPI
jgi:hypothetical protein